MDEDAQEKWMQRDPAERRQRSNWTDLTDAAAGREALDEVLCQLGYLPRSELVTGGSRKVLRIVDMLHAAGFVLRRKER